MKIKAIPAFSDNYIWLIQVGNEVLVVDPGEAQGVEEYLKENSLALGGILLTHNHDDHIGGVERLLHIYPETPVFGPAEVIKFAHHIVEEGNTFQILGLKFKILGTGGHTQGHISYLLEDKLFCGDALFVGGCGRNFTGDLSLQYNDLQKLKELPDDTEIYAAHEYSLGNLKFAQSILPENKAIAEAISIVEEKLSRGQVTMPTTIGEEKTYNPFLLAENLEEFTERRKAKDNF